MEGKQKDGDKLGNTAAGSSDAEFEKLLAEVRSTLSLLLASDVFRAPILLGKQACWHALTCIVRQPHP